MMDSIQSILVHVGLDRLGDGLLKLPFVHGLKAAYPNAHITWFAGKETSVYTHTLAPLVDGYIDDVIEYGGVGVTAWELLHPRPLKQFKFDLVIDTQRIVWTSLSAKRIRHEMFISPAGRFLLSDKKPYKGYRYPRAMQRQMLDLLEIASNQEFLTPPQLNIHPPDTAQQLAAELLPHGRDYVAFAPGSGGRPKCWPLERFIEVAGIVAKDGRTPVFLIGPQEEEWIADIFTAVPDAVLPLQENGGPERHGYDPLVTIALGQRIHGSVSNDSGIAHMLAVAGAPLVALYGPTVYEKFPPMTDLITVIKAEKFGGREISSIPVDAVIEAVRQLPPRAPAS